MAKPKTGSQGPAAKSAAPGGAAEGRRVSEIMSRLPLGVVGVFDKEPPASVRASELPLKFLEYIGTAAAAYLAADPERPGAAHLRQASDMVDKALKAIEYGRAGTAARCAGSAVHAAWQAEMIEARSRWFDLKVAPRVKAADDRSKQMSQFGASGTEARRKYSEDDHQRWRQLIADDPDLRRLYETSVKRCAERIAEREQLPPEAVETIRRVTAKKMVGNLGSPKP